MTLEGDLELYLFTDVWESSVTVVILVQRLRETEHDPGQRVGWPRPLSYPQAVLRLCAGSVVTCSGLVPSPLDLCPKIPRRDFGDDHIPHHGNREAVYHNHRLSKHCANLTASRPRAVPGPNSNPLPSTQGGEPIEIIGKVWDDLP